MAHNQNTLTMPRGQVRNEVWSADHKDTGHTLKYLNDCRQLGERPTLAVWKRTDKGTELFEKYKATKFKQLQLEDDCQALVSVFAKWWW